MSVFLVVISWLVFGQTLGHDFVNYDDRTYVYGNPIVTEGVTLRGIAWAFTHSHAGNWHPLTTLSHMLDCQFFGANAAGHHFVNVLLHTLAVLLLFSALRQMTGAIWRSAFVAAVFAVHPLRVESVAWIAERKDVLSALFFMLTVGAYARYARQPSLGRYVMMLILFVCGLMSKPMLVTLPLVLLLLDYWPLNRIGDLDALRQKVFEKIPLLALSIPSCIVTFLVQERSPGSIAQLPFTWRIENAIVSFVTYIWEMLWPVDLAVFYPHPEDHLAIWQLALATAFLIAVTGLVVVWRRTRPYLLVGWLWYIAMLLPVIGIVEVGLQGHADRYTYLPQIGLYLAITWLVADLSMPLRYRRQILTAGAGIVMAALGACAWKQTSYWRNGETLWTHTLAVTHDNDVAHTNFGMLLAERGQVDDAISHIQTALQIRSGGVQPHYDLSLALIHSDLGYAFARKGLVDEAITHLRKAVELQPDYADAHYNLGTALFQKGQIDGAIAEWQTTLSIRPDDAQTHTSFGNALVQKGALPEAIAHYQAALEIAPHSILPLNNLAWLLSTSPDETIRNGPRALELAQLAVQFSGDKNPIFVRTLAASYAEIGQFNNAVATAQLALQLARTQDDTELAREIENDLDLYRSNRPLRDQSLTDTHSAR